MAGVPPDSEVVDQLVAAPTPAARFEVLRSVAASIDPSATATAYDYERLATTISTAQVDICGPVEAAWAEEPDQALAFLLFSIAYNGRRRALQSTDAQRLVREGRARFGILGLFRHYEAMALLDGSVADLRAGLPIAREAVAMLSGHAGAIHTCAVFIAELGSAGEATADELAEGIRMADQAIALHRDRGRFYATRAKLLRLAGAYDRARADLAAAIALESRSAQDARLRIDGYLLERAIVDALSEVDRKLMTRSEAILASVEDRTNDVARRLDDSQVRVIETIGFVTAVLGIVLSSANMIGGERSPQDSAVILAVLAIILLGSVALGSWILRRGRR